MRIFAFITCVFFCMILLLRYPGEKDAYVAASLFGIGKAADDTGTVAPAEAPEPAVNLSETGKSISGPPKMEDLKNIRERFTYEVRYGFLRLGDVHVYFKDDTEYREKPVRHLVTEMVSNRRLPIIGYREAHYHDYIAYNDSIPYGVRFWQNSLHHDMTKRYLYDYDYESGYVFSFEEGEAVDTLELDRPSDSGPALFYYSRLFAGTDTYQTYPIYIDHEQSEIEMTFTTEKEPYESKAFPDEEFMAYYMEGNADFEGPFGFSGNFSAYFKDDELRIPLEARVSIWLGSVRVRLVEYERLD